MLKGIVTTGLAAAMATGASAGGFSDEIIEPIEIIEVAGPDGSLPGWVIPAAVVIALLALAANSGTGGGGEDTGGGGSLTGGSGADQS